MLTGKEFANALMVLQHRWCNAHLIRKITH
jgi:hypothetical protein